MLLRHGDGGVGGVPGAAGVDSPYGELLGCGRNFQDGSGEASSLKAQLVRGRQSESDGKGRLGIPPYRLQLARMRLLRLDILTPLHDSSRPGPQTGGKEKRNLRPFGWQLLRHSEQQGLQSVTLARVPQLLPQLLACSQRVPERGKGEGRRDIR